MHLIACVDNRFGMSFCGHRQSRDREVIAHILRLAKDSDLWVGPYSQKLFPCDQVCVAKDFQNAAKDGDYCFVEKSVPAEVYEKLESVTLYHWNRNYPSTVKFPMTILASMHRESVEEFAGFSHNIITMERYVP